MAIYSEKFKLMIVKEYQNEKIRYDLLAQKHGIKSSSQIIRWVKLYNKFGKEGLRRKTQKEIYTVHFKIDILDKALVY